MVDFHIFEVKVKLGLELFGSFVAITTIKKVSSLSKLTESYFRVLATFLFLRIIVIKWL